MGNFSADAEVPEDLVIPTVKCVHEPDWNRDLAAVLGEDFAVDAFHDDYFGEDLATGFRAFAAAIDGLLPSFENDAEFVQPLHAPANVPLELEDAAQRHCAGAAAEAHTRIKKREKGAENPADQQQPDRAEYAHEDLDEDPHVGPAGIEKRQVEKQ